MQRNLLGICFNLEKGMNLCSNTEPIQLIELLSLLVKSGQILYQQYQRRTLHLVIKTINTNGQNRVPIYYTQNCYQKHETQVRLLGPVGVD